MSKRKNKAVWAATALPKIVRKQVSAERAGRTGPARYVFRSIVGGIPL